MPFDHEDFQRSSDRKQADRTHELMPLIRTLEAAAPVMSALMTTSDAWNRYLAILSGMEETMKNARDNAQHAFCAPSLWEPSQLIKIKADILQAQAMIDLMDAVMQLPKAIVDGGFVAKEIVQQFEAKYAGTPDKTLP